HADNGDSIIFTPAVRGSPIVLTQGELLLNHNVTLEPLFDAPETISGAGNQVAFEVASGAHVALIDLNITGGAIKIDSGGMLAVNDCTLSGNFGGAITNYGALTVYDSVLSGNSAQYGGAIANYGGTVMVRGSVLSANTAYYVGGAIYNVLGA